VDYTVLFTQYTYVLMINDC